MRFYPFEMMMMPMAMMSRAPMTPPAAQIQAQAATPQPPGQMVTPQLQTQYQYRYLDYRADWLRADIQAQGLNQQQQVNPQLQQQQLYQGFGDIGRPLL